MNKDLTPSAQEVEPLAGLGEASPRGTISLNEILVQFKTGIAKAIKEAMDKAYSDFVNECDIWTRDDVEVNTASHARDAIRQMLAGQDPAYVVSHIKTYGLDQANTIRDLIWKQCGDELVKKSLEEKDKEIARLKELFASMRF